MKWEALLAMLGLFLLGLWLVLGPSIHAGVPAPGVTLHAVHIGEHRGVLEVKQLDGEPASFRMLWRHAEPSAFMNREQAELALGHGVVASVLEAPPNGLFRLFNITTWTSLAWIALGLAGQIAFFGRMAIQWIVSEKERRSVVPAAFWYLSLAGGMLLFAYFIWRKDIVGVLGQTTGVVIYARNVRLIFKDRRRQRRDAAVAATTRSESPEQAASSATL